MKICGIYKITSPSKRVYIGQSVNCHKREKWYKYGANEQRMLNNSILKYGWEAHKFEIIHECNEAELNELEKYYATLFNSYSKSAGLNIRECGGSKGRLSDETKKIMSVVQKGRYKNNPELRNRLGNFNRGKKPSEEVRIKISNSLKGKQKGKIISKETREKLSKAIKGKKLSQETKALMSSQRKGRRLSNETKEKLRIAGTGRKHSEESKKKMSDIQKGEKAFWYGKKMADNIKIKISNKLKGKVFSAETKLKISESLKGVKNPNFGKKNTPEMKRVNSEKNSRGKNANAKIVLNTETGIYYDCTKDAWESFRHKSFEYFKFKLQGKYENNTSFIYV